MILIVIAGCTLFFISCKNTNKQNNNISMIDNNEIHEQDIEYSFLDYVKNINLVAHGEKITFEQDKTDYYTWQQMIDEKIITIDNNIMYFGENINKINSIVVNKDITEIGYNSELSYEKYLDLYIILFEENSQCEKICTNYLHNLIYINLPNNLKEMPYLDAMIKLFYIENKSDFNINNDQIEIATNVSELNNILYIKNNYFIIKDSGNIELFSTLDREKVCNEIIPDYINKISPLAFHNCKNLKSIVIDDNVKSIGRGAFIDCLNLNSVKLPSDLTCIDNMLFANCYNLRDINIPPKVNRIEVSSFTNCYNLTSITIPNSVIYISDYAFSCCYKLVEIYNFSKLDVVNYNKDNGNIAYYAKVVHNRQELSRISVMDNIIYYNFEKECIAIGLKDYNVESIIISEKCNEITEYALSDCKKLENIYYNGTIETWCKIKFTKENCNPMFYAKNFFIKNDATYEKITEINVPNSITRINDYCFYNFSDSEIINIPNSVNYIGKYALYGCDKLIKLSIPFIGNNRNENQQWEADSVLGSIFGYSKDLSKNTISQRYSRGYWSSSNSNGSFPFTAKFNIPDSLREVSVTDAINIPYGAFYNCSNLIKINISNTIMHVGEYAFYNCNSLEYNKQGTRLYLGNSVNPYLILVKECDKNILSVNIDSDTKVIYDSAFSDCLNLEEIFIPNNITSIGNGVFKNCNNVSKVSLPFVGSSRDVNRTYDSIFYYIFGCSDIIEDGTSKLYFEPSTAGVGYYYKPKNIKEINITDAICIPCYAFNECSSISSLIVGDRVTIISYAAFRNCSNLKIVKLPDSLKTIERYAFKNCTSLTEIDIPNSVLKIEETVFSGCSSLKKLNVSDNIEIFESGIVDYNITYYNQNAFDNFYNCNNLEFNEYDNGYYLGNDYHPFLVLVKLKDKSISTMTIHEQTRVIYDMVFSYCDNLTNITIPTNVKSIGNLVFNNCSKLSEIIIPSSVENIGFGSFWNCNNLSTITLPFIGSSKNNDNNNVCSVFGYIFSPTNWSSGTIQQIDYNATHSYNIPKSIKNVILTDLTHIPFGAFSGCDFLETITIPNSVESIGDYAFYGCDNLHTNKYDNAYYIGKESNPYWILIKTINASIDSVIINENCKFISSYAFNDCTNLKSINIPDSVLCVGSYAFCNCINLTNVTIGKNVTEIGYNAFYKCSAISTIIIPDSVLNIQSNAFSDCYRLVEVYNYSNLNISIGETSYGYAGYYAKVIHRAIEESKLHTIDNVIYYINGNNKIAIGLSDYSVSSVTLSDDCTEINQYTFYHCSSLTSITIPNNVTSIGEYTFDGCSSLTSITIPNNVTSIAEYTFSGCRSLTSIIIPNSVTSIGNFAFRYCSSLTSITLPNSVTSIGDKAFYGCRSLTSITIPNSVTSIGVAAFIGCSSLISITIPNSVTSIGEYAFYDCTSLTIYCEATSKPGGWDTDWNISDRPVYWYSETQKDGCWHYVNGVVTLW